ncbi:unnamed protein product [Fraxinus pennsylvanica]|uniref:Uncharacterized protein n=1 Tax=Fraxinus pennsylvanica TaxID=56036 RepID=A0AAD1ZZL2_9LAMI|nr:unnamed protein product [Fraxinus pennsylvanica]
MVNHHHCHIKIYLVTYKSKLRPPLRLSEPVSKGLNVRQPDCNHSPRTLHSILQPLFSLNPLNFFGEPSTPPPNLIRPGPYQYPMPAYHKSNPLRCHTIYY